MTKSTKMSVQNLGAVKIQGFFCEKAKLSEYCDFILPIVSCAVALLKNSKTKYFRQERKTTSTNSLTSEFCL